MRRRIVGLAVGVAALGVALFGLPLAVGAARVLRDEEHVRLQRTAVAAAAEVPPDFPASGDAVELPAVTGARRLGLYGPDGRRLLGTGPIAGDAPVRRATSTALVADDLRDDQVTTAVPVLQDENVVAVVRAEAPSSVLAARRHEAWAAMAALGVVVLAGTWLVAWFSAARLGRPVAQLAVAAQSLGAGDFTVRAPQTGLREVDQVGAALNATAAQLGALVERERSFSSDASHQLRTPLAGLRLRLEVALEEGDHALRSAAAGALDDVERLERTVTELLRLARVRRSDREPVDVDALLSGVEATWKSRLAAGGRRLELVVGDQLPQVRTSAAALVHALDVLVANAVEHGAGAVTVRAAPADGGGLAIDVGDEGAGVGPDRVPGLFTRTEVTPDGHGIGLALAASLVRAEGGRLSLLRAGANPKFRILLPDDEEPA